MHDCTSPGSRLAAAQEVEEVGGRARPSPKRFLTSATAASRSQSGDASWPGRHGSSTGAGSSMVPRPVEVGVGLGEPQLRGGDVGLVAGEQVVVHLHHDPACPARGVRRTRLWCTDSSPPGAQAPSHAASSMPWKVSRPVPPKQVQPSPGDSSSSCSACRHLVGRDLEQDDVVDDVGVAGQHVGAGQPGVLVQLGVEQEAAVVVGAVAGGCRRRVGLGHGDGPPRLAVAERPEPYLAVPVRVAGSVLTRRGRRVGLRCGRGRVVVRSGAAAGRRHDRRRGDDHPEPSRRHGAIVPRRR